ncbi:MAG: hypothetical protein ABSG03_11180 [Bryobacteraceae bacterium]|jgi:hypothetical protein
MSSPTTSLGAAVWQMPPLILHPFNERVSPGTLMENSKAALMLSGLIPSEGIDREELKRRLLTGRHCEIRMLYFLGKDVFRWIGQCMEIVERTPELESTGVKRQSFAGLLTGGPPATVREKLIRWGVADYPAVFARAIGLNTLFAEPPEFPALAEDFLRHYHSAASLLYQSFIDAEPHRAIDGKSFQFELYASGEYTKMLETEWSGA